MSKLLYTLKCVDDEGVCHEWEQVLRGTVTVGHVIIHLKKGQVFSDNMVVVTVMHDGLDTILYVQPYKKAMKVIYKRNCGIEVPFHGNEVQGKEWSL